MEPLHEVRGAVVPLLRDNVDTDAIIPAEYMRSLSASQGDGLFARWRYREGGALDTSFVLNDPRYRGANVLLAGANFGCGSSRENAVWALREYGFRCVLARSYSDIFYANCFKNGVLPVRLPHAMHVRLVARSTEASALHVVVNVEKRTVAWDTALVQFEIDARKQQALLSGLDGIALTQQWRPSIVEFRQAHRARAPWLYDVVDGHAARKS